MKGFFFFICAGQRKTKTHFHPKTFNISYDSFLTLLHPNPKLFLFVMLVPFSNSLPKKLILFQLSRRRTTINITAYHFVIQDYIYKINAVSVHKSAARLLHLVHIKYQMNKCQIKPKNQIPLSY